MDDSLFIIFIAFGCLWLVMGIAGWIALIKFDGQKVGFGKWGLVVALPILIPIVVALVFGAVYRH